MVHGLAGSAALLLLLLPVIPGSIAGMVIMSCMVGLPTHLMAERFLKVSLAVRALAGLFSLSFGIWLLQGLIHAG